MLLLSTVRVLFVLPVLLRVHCACTVRFSRVLEMYVGAAARVEGMARAGRGSGEMGRESGRGFLGE